MTNSSTLLYIVINLLADLTSMVISICPTKRDGQACFEWSKLAFAVSSVTLRYYDAIIVNLYLQRTYDGPFDTGSALLSNTGCKHRIVLLKNRFGVHLFENY